MQDKAYQIIKKQLEKEIVLNRNKALNAGFENKQTQQIITYIKKKYNDQMQFLWLKFPQYAVFRHDQNKKWYGILMTLSERKLGIDSDEIAQIISLKAKPSDIVNLLDHKSYFPAYHMNKKHWFSLKLDGRVNIKKIYAFIDESYNITQ